MYSPTVRKGNSCQIQRFPSPNMSDLACKIRSMSTSNNLTEASRTTLVQARGRGKLDISTFPTIVKVNILGTGQHLSTLGGSTNSSPSYLSRLLPRTSNKLPRHWITYFARKLVWSLGGLCTIQDSQNTCVMLHGTMRHTSTLHISPGAGARTPIP